MKKILSVSLLLISFISWSQISVPKEVKSSDKVSLSDTQIEEAVKKDSELQKEVIEGLKKDPQSKTTVTALEKKSKGSKSNLIKGVFTDEKLQKKAIEYVKKDKKLMERAKKIIGL